MHLFKRLLISISIFIVVILLGAFVYHKVENWRFLDSVYFTVVTVTTVGYGDFYPQTDTGKIFTIFFSFFGIGMAFYFFSLIGRYLFSRHLRDRLHERTSKNNIGYKKIKI